MSEEQKVSGEPKVRKHSHRRNRQTRVHRESAIWVITPGMTEFLTKGLWDLNRVAELNGQSGMEVTHIQVANVEGEKKVYIWPTHKDDLDGLALRRAQGKVRVNLGSFLEECDLTIPVKTKERFRLAIVPEDETPAGVPSALCFDLDKPVARKALSRKKKQDSQPATPAKESAAGAQEPDVNA